jgi:succinyl-diaminopimelate desuccinylase
LTARRAEASPASDPLPLAQALIRCRSVTPADDGALDVLGAALEPLGFAAWRLDFGSTPNLFARRGSGAPHVCFAGHTDVVPAGDAALWTHDPFAGEIADGILYGRGACDMKGAVAAFVAACARRRERGGSVSLLVTGDEEGPATDGTVRVLQWLAERGETPDLCMVGEPTNPTRLGEVVKIGRRGSLNASIVVHGTQGHSAYPQRADNPVHRLTRALAALIAAPLDAGSARFEPSSVQVTSIDVGNPASNVIPALARAKLNIRFNDHHTGASLEAWLRTTIARYAERFDLTVTVSGESFRTEPGPWTAALCAAIEAATGVAPRLDTGGGTSDARFVARYCPVAEFGLVGASMHQADEHVPVADLNRLAEIYAGVLAAVLP